MTMKNVWLAFGLLLMTHVASAQLTPVFGVKAGPTFRTSFLGGEDTGDDKTGLLLGFHVGGIVEFDLNDQTTFQSGLTIISKGTKITNDGDDFKISPVYLQIPLALLWDVSDYRLGAGVYLATGMGGKIKDEDGDTDKIEFGKTWDDDWSSTDLGLYLTGSRAAGPVHVGATVEIGLSDTVPKEVRDDGVDYHWHNFVISLFASYYFQ
jgi:hypothetical protein